ncbi:hypothetical protein BDQ12DRAFT_666064 [Crucibulum laeve]|uniref:Uncharacterized protein n=1 Tax=Crucibulum laeve TaxID=68775 RepID=A0A5C3M233_9AGAR|nr:hypothetical protein BDQ12DRAFT_666064 [Crucibulum laeve]
MSEQYSAIPTAQQILEAELLLCKAKKATKASKLSVKKPMLNEEKKENKRPMASRVERDVKVENRKQDNDCICWADIVNHHLTDSLLTKIEDSFKYQKVFGFNVGDIEVKSGDLNIIKVCCILVPLLFPNHPLSVEKLAHSIKSHITYVLSPKKSFEDSKSEDDLPSSPSHALVPVATQTPVPILKALVHSTSSPAISDTPKLSDKNKHPFKYMQEVYDNLQAKTKIEHEEMQIKAQMELEKLQQEHELKVLDKQLELAHIQAGVH